MLSLVLRRLGLLLLSAVAIVYLAFFGVSAMGSVQPDAPRPPISEAFDTANKETVAFFSGMVRGQVSEVETVSGPRPLSEIIWFAYKNSLLLVLMATVVAAVIGVALGIMAALSRLQLSEYSILILATVGISAPSFLVAVLLQRGGIFLTQNLGYRVVSMGGYAWDVDHLLLPLTVLLLRPLAVVTSRTHAALRGIMQQDYIRTAFAKGLNRSRTVFVHALKNLAVPVMTATGISFRFALSTLVIVELMFAWPGLAYNALQGVEMRSPLLVAACALMLGVTIQISFMLLDVLYRIVDPRMREST